LIQLERVLTYLTSSQLHILLDIQIGVVVTITLLPLFFFEVSTKNMRTNFKKNVKYEFGWHNIDWVKVKNFVHQQQV
jgi:hypothetical protein